MLLSMFDVHVLRLVDLNLDDYNLLHALHIGLSIFSTKMVGAKCYREYKFNTTKHLFLKYLTGQNEIHAFDLLIKNVSPQEDNALAFILLQDQHQ